MPKLLATLLFLLLFIYCSDPLSEEGANHSNQQELPLDSNVIYKAELPIHFDSTDYLIHPIGKYEPAGNNQKYYGINKSSSSATRILTHQNNYSVNGHFTNLKFQHIDSSQMMPLTDKPIQITSFTFLHSLFRSSGQQLLLYTVTDKDTNEDQKLDDQDITSLCISDIHGRNFRQLTPDTQDLNDWKVIAGINRLYFTTSDPVLKSESLDKNRFYYYYVDLLGEDKKVKEYQPVDGR